MAIRMGRTAGSVRGLGVCDVLRAQLEPVQRAGLVEQLDLRIAVAELDALPVLRRLRAGVPAAPRGPFMFTGPADLVTEIVDSCLRVALDRACARVGEHARGMVASAELEAAGAWIETALDGGAVEAFCFEPGLDPARL